MTNTQITALRELHESTKQSVLKQRTYTAKEMALKPHTLSRSGDMAETPEGETYIWDARFNHWARWF